jgi:hypothetical protein
MEEKLKNLRDFYLHACKEFPERRIPFTIAYLRDKAKLYKSYIPKI